MRDFWFQRSARERLLLAVLLAASLLWLAFQFAWLPLKGHLSDYRQGYEQERLTLEWMQAATAEVEHLRAGGAVTTAGLDGKAPYVAVSESLKDWLKKIPRPDTIEATPDNGVRLSWGAVYFDELVRFLFHLNERFGLTVTVFSSTRNNDYGEISVRLTLAAEPSGDP